MIKIQVIPETPIYRLILHAATPKISSIAIAKAVGDTEKTAKLNSLRVDESTWLLTGSADFLGILGIPGMQNLSISHAKLEIWGESSAERITQEFGIDITDETLPEGKCLAVGKDGSFEVIWHCCENCYVLYLPIERAAALVV